MRAIPASGRHHVLTYVLTCSGCKCWCCVTRLLRCRECAPKTTAGCLARKAGPKAKGRGREAEKRRRRAGKQQRSRAEEKQRSREAEQQRRR